MGRTTTSKSKVKVHKAIETKTDFFYYAFRNILLVSVPLAVVSGLALSHLSLHSSAEGNTNSIDSINLTLHTSCTISATEVTPHTAVLEGSGLHRENIGTTKVGVFCNDNNGYNIYAIGHSNNIDGNTDLVVSGLSSNYNINTGVYSSGDTVSSWGMKLTAGTGTGAGGEAVTPPNIVNGYNNYSAVPNVYTLVASRPSGTNMNKDADVDVTGSYFTTTYDAYASPIQPAGTYNGKVKYILTHPNTNAPNTINDIDAAFAMNDKQKVYQDANGSYYAMQDMTSDICTSVTRKGTSTATQLVDLRDNKLYWVAKLDDDKCWMTQNLDLDLSSSVALTSETSDIDPTTYGTGIYTSATGYSKNETTGVVSWLPSTMDSGNVQRADTIVMNGTSVPNWTSNNNNPYSADPGDRYRYTNSSYTENNYTSLEACAIANNGDTEGCKHGHYGNYYNWSAAVASNNTNGASSSQTNSICPKNWDLPADGKYATMLSAQGVYDSGSNYVKEDTVNVGFQRLITAPLYFAQFGYVNGGSLRDLGSFGCYWSSTVSSSTNSYYLTFSGNNIWPSYSNGRLYGFPVRCMVSV